VPFLMDWTVEVGPAMRRLTSAPHFGHGGLGSDILWARSNSRSQLAQRYAYVGMKRATA